MHFWELGFKSKLLKSIVVIMILIITIIIIMRKWRSQLFAETLSVDKIGRVHKQVAFKLFVSNAT